MNLWFEGLVIVALTLVNAFFAGAEIAILALRKTRLQELAEDGHSGAAVVLRLRENPERFLATVQVGITVVGASAGAFGGAVLDSQSPLRCCDWGSVPTQRRSSLLRRSSPSCPFFRSYWASSSRSPSPSVTPSASPDHWRGYARQNQEWTRDAQLGLAVRHARVSVAATANGEATKDLTHLSAMSLLLQVGQVQLVDDAAELVRDLRVLFARVETVANGDEAYPPELEEAEQRVEVLVVAREARRVVDEKRVELLRLRRLLQGLQPGP